MATLTPSLTLRPPATPRLGKRDIWLVSPFYDLTFIIFSSVLLVFPHISFELISSNIFVDLIVTMLIGGPHLFATYTMTLMEPDFRKRYPVYSRGALLLPIIIVTIAVLNLTLLVTIFFFWASVHVIHQVAYISDAYRMKDPRGWRWSSRIIDYGIVCSAIYPIATSKLIHSEFQTGGRTLLFPDFLRLEWVPGVMWGIFIFFTIAFIVKTVWEYRNGLFHGPKTLHIAMAAVLFLWTPALQNLDVAFQGLNVWHSFQYLALVLYLNRLRAERGYMSSHVAAVVSRRGYTLYGMCLAFTLGAGIVFLSVLAIVVHLGLFQTGDMMNSLFHGQVFQGQHYFAFYSVILSFLLIHYYFDHFIFLGIDKKITPDFAPLKGA